MTRLSDATFCDLLFRCYTNPGYSALIVFNNVNNFTEFGESIVKQDLTDVIGITSVNINGVIGSIAFENGSIVRLRICEYDDTGLPAIPEKRKQLKREFDCILYFRDGQAQTEDDDQAQMTLEELVGAI